MMMTDPRFAELPMGARLLGLAVISAGGSLARESIAGLFAAERPDPAILAGWLAALVAAGFVVDNGVTVRVALAP